LYHDDMVIDRNKAHHAYCIEADRPQAFDFLEKEVYPAFDLKTKGNPDYWFYECDTFSIDESRALRARAAVTSFGGGKKVFVLAANFITHEAQNSLLKLFEEPTPDTHFFLLIPSSRVLAPTLRSRFEIIRVKRVEADEEDAYDFLEASLPKRLSKTAKMAKSVSDEKISRAEVISFLDRVESVLSRQKSKNYDSMRGLIEARRSLSGRAPAVKMILETLAIALPITRSV